MVRQQYEDTQLHPSIALRKSYVLLSVTVNATVKAA